MSKVLETLELIDRTFTEGVSKGVMHLDTEDESFRGRVIRVQGDDLLHFGSCSYLGLELDERLKQGAIDFTNRYGTQFSSSRAYLSATPYAQIEEMFEVLFGNPTIMTPTTTLGHLSALPVLVEEEDAVILDQQVHNSVQMAVNQVRIKGTRIEIVRHNRMDLLEERIRYLSKKHKRIWYLADGVYSMYGDVAPFDELFRMLNEYESFYLYVDDAHGMSWAGAHGRGFALKDEPQHERMILATSLNKAFASAGGVLVLSDLEMKRKIRTCGAPLIFSGPVQPPLLGAAMASARIHLSDEITSLQDELQKRINYCNALLEHYGLPVVSTDPIPIRFIGVGLPRVAYNIAQRMQKEGFYLNPAVFPAVPMRRSGVRFTITLFNTMEDIKRMVETLAYHFYEALEEEQTTLEDIYTAFNRSGTTFFAEERKLQNRNPSLRLEHARTIKEVDAKEWDRLLGKNGSFTWEALRFLEDTFQDQRKIEENWNFHYYVVRDEKGEPIVATFFTDALWKDDMIEPSEVSWKIEELRNNEQGPYYLTSRVFMMGSLLTEGNHLYFNRSKNWKEAFDLVLSHARQQQIECGAQSLVLRDLDLDDEELAQYLHHQGFVRQEMPLDSMVIDITWKDEEELLAQSSYKRRRRIRTEMIRYEPYYEIEILNEQSRPITAEEAAHFYELYLNVKERNVEFNTFALPENLFKKMMDYPNWEIIALRLRDSDELPVGMIASFVEKDHIVPLVMGIDYRYLESHRVYRQALWQALKRARQLNVQKVFFGLGAPFEKSRLGAVPHKHAVYFQSNDHYNTRIIEEIRAVVRSGK